MKVLVIAYFFPPQSSVGIYRTLRLLKRLREQGHEAQILTVRHPDPVFHPYTGPMPAEDEHEGFRVHRVREWPIHWLWQWPTRALMLLGRLLGKKLTDSQLVQHFWFVDLQYGWLPPAWRVGRDLVRSFKPDVIYVSCPPFSSALLARLLARTAGRPYLLDFRDSWLCSAYTAMVDKRRYGRLENNLIRDAHALLVTTPSDQQSYQAQCQRLGCDASKVHWLSNAYDPIFRELPERTQPSSRLCLLYTGAWDSVARSPRNLLLALEQVDFPWRLSSVGPNNEQLLSAAQGLNLQHGELDCHDAVPKPELLPLVAQADLLFLIQGEPAPGQPNTHIAAKTFDYLATGKPILALTAPGDNREFLSEQPGVFQADAADLQAIISTLTELQSRYKAGNLPAAPREVFLNRYSGEQLADRCIEIMRGATGA